MVDKVDVDWGKIYLESVRTVRHRLSDIVTLTPVPFEVQRGDRKERKVLVKLRLGLGWGQLAATTELLTIVLSLTTAPESRPRSLPYHITVGLTFLLLEHGVGVSIGLQLSTRQMTYQHQHNNNVRFESLWSLSVAG